jgi:hypothetical protein
MANPNVLPGQTGQPPKNVKGPSFNTMQWVHTTTPKVDYAEGNPGQETSPLQNKVWGNDSQKPAFPTTSNEKNGGRGMANGGGVG